jgi:glycosyltransferase involved in cell wall biosynthesis
MIIKDFNTNLIRLIKVNLMVSLAVLLIAYGRYRFLNEAISSIAAQTRKPDEVIVFTDNREVVQNVLNRYGVEAEIFEEPELSLPATYARVSEVSMADYILPLEDDDIFKPNKVEVLERYCRDYPLIKHAADFIDEESKPTNWIEQPERPILITRENAWYLQLSFPYHVWPSTFAVRTSLLRKYKEILMKLKLHADFIIFVLALMEGNVLYIPDKLTYYRVGSGNSQLISCDRLPKVLCTWNKYAYDDEFLLKYIHDKLIGKLILPTYLSHLLCTYLLNNFYNCEYKHYSHYLQLLSACVKCIIEYFQYLHKHFPLKRMGLAMLSPLLGRETAGKLLRKRLCISINK